MANICQQDVKTASKKSDLTCQSWRLVTFRSNFKKLHNLDQIGVSNFYNLNPKWSISQFEIQRQF